MVRKLLGLLIVLSLVGCASGKDRHDKFYSAIQKVAEEQRQADADNLRLKVELVKALFSRSATAVNYTPISAGAYNTDLVKIMATMMIFNDHKDPRRLQYALERIPAPAPTIGERVSDGVFRVLPSVIGIAAGAYALDSVRRAAEGVSAFAAGAGSTSVSSSTTNNYKYQSDNTQAVDATMNGHGGGGGAGSGGRVSDSGNQNMAIGQQQNFDGGPVAFGSDSFQAPPPPVTGGPTILPVMP